MPSSGPGRRISATDQRKVFRFDPAQGGTSVPDRRHREPLFGKGFSDPGLRSLVAVNDEDLTLHRIHWQLFEGNERFMRRQLLPEVVHSAICFARLLKQIRSDCPTNW